ncbi:hypothetical protein NQZ68_032003 [Dissostichus eleginoides]|nr:hypothetical protein NQZ68_032003 [Dissostichus eleginoides]
MDWGSEFQRVGAATEKALPPQDLRLVRVGGDRRLAAAERRERVGVCLWRRSVRWGGQEVGSSRAEGASGSVSVEEVSQVGGTGGWQQQSGGSEWECVCGGGQSGGGHRRLAAAERRERVGVCLWRRSVRWGGQEVGSSRAEGASGSVSVEEVSQVGGTGGWQQQSGGSEWECGFPMMNHGPLLLSLQPGQTMQPLTLIQAASLGQLVPGLSGQDRPHPLQRPPPEDPQRPPWSVSLPPVVT